MSAGIYTDTKSTTDGQVYGPAWVEVMSDTLRLVLPYPPSANRYWRWVPRMGNVPSAEALKYRTDVAKLLAGCRPLVGRIQVTACRIFRPRKVGDLVNRVKVLEDALQGFAYLDDGQIWAYRDLERWDDSARPRVEMELSGERFATPDEIREWAMARARASAKRKASRRKTA